MVEANNSGKLNEGAGEAIDLNKYVPKEDAEKALKDKDNAVLSMRKELDEAKMSLLDPDYISFLENKRNATGALNKVTKDIANVEGQIDHASKAELTELRQALTNLSARQQDIMAVLELQAVEKKHKDFDEYRDQVVHILETSQTPLTIEQAYKLAKMESKEEKTDEEKEAAAKSSAEKPSSTVAAGAVQAKSFKTKADALDDAWNSVVGAGKDTL
jgi:predicted Zn-ribbon and HTH transcriptional regulator